MAGLKIPSSFRRYIVKELGTKFRDIVDLVTVPMLKPGPKDLLIRTRYSPAITLLPQIKITSIYLWPTDPAHGLVYRS